MIINITTDPIGYNEFNNWEIFELDEIVEFNVSPGYVLPKVGIGGHIRVQDCDDEKQTSLTDIVGYNVSDIVGFNVSDIVGFNVSDIVGYNVSDIVGYNVSDIVGYKVSDIVGFNVFVGNNVWTGGLVYEQ